MLFNSYIFIFLFLPCVLAVFYTMGGKGYHQAAIAWLVMASLFFYGWWNPAYLTLLIFSIIFNYSIGLLLGHASIQRKKTRYTLLSLGVGINLALLAYFKYANFFVDNFNIITHGTWHIESIILPLAISFFTFQQVAYLVDAYRYKTKEYNFLHYTLFVTFFPQLIAGPIVHHKELLPQFAKKNMYKFSHTHLAIGLSIFFLGLFKKVVLADGIAEYSDPIFNAADHDVAITFLEAWGGSLSYTLQLYFDFSAYSDMAIGIARMFRIDLPLNFFSPYRSENIIEFWRRWHITLSRFLRDYLYIPLGGSRQGRIRQFMNVMITMLLGGLWHGAGWTFIVWGLLHGAYIIVNHIWRSLRQYMGDNLQKNTWLGRKTAQGITFLAVVVAWVFFRSESMGGAMNMLAGMAGLHGIILPEGFDGLAATFFPIVELSVAISTRDHAFYTMTPYYWILSLLLICWLFPNIQQFMTKYRNIFMPDDWKHDQPVITLTWSKTLKISLVMGVVVATALLFVVRESPFLYFQF